MVCWTWKDVLHQQDPVTNLMALATNCTMAVAVLPLLFVIFTESTDVTITCDYDISFYLQILCIFKILFACAHIGSGFGRPGDIYWKYSILGMYIIYIYISETNLISINHIHYIMIHYSHPSL